MDSLQELFDALRQQVVEVNNAIKQKDELISAIRGEIDEEIPNKKKNIYRQLKDIESYRKRLEEYIDLAKDYLSSPNYQSASARPLNFNRLETWASLIKKDSKDDPYAQRLFIMCNCNLMFLKEKKAEYEKKLSELDVVDTTDAQKGIKALEDERKKLEFQYNEILAGDLMSKFKKALDASVIGPYAVKKVSDSFSIVSMASSYAEKKDEMTAASIGAVAKIIPFPENYRERVNEVLRSNMYDKETGIIWLPLEIDTVSEKTLFVSYSTSVDNNAVNSGLRYLLYRNMDENRTGGMTTYFIDALHYNASILGPLKRLEDSAVLKPVPKNNEQIENQLGEIVSKFAEYDEIIDSYESLYDYNLRAEEGKKLKRTALFLVGYPSAFSQKAKDLVQRILVNQNRFNINVILVNQYSENSGLSYSGVPAHISDSSWRVVYDQKMCRIQKGIDGVFSKFSFYRIERDEFVSDQYISDIKKQVSDKSDQGNNYAKRIDTSDLSIENRGTKCISIPVAVDSKDAVFELNFDKQNYAHFVTGAVGSGKTMLLTDIVTGVLKKYHPDDVELWMADFKKLEFSRFVDPMPAHVKYILLDDSRDLIYDFLDKLSDELVCRQNFFMKNPGIKNFEAVPSSIYMPAIMVVVDDFDVMSKAVSESEIYKNKLQKLLVQGGDCGFKFVFASESYAEGKVGLTSIGLDQIKTRIALYNTSGEITDTLDISNTDMTEQISTYVSLLQPYYAIIKQNRGEEFSINRVSIMYFEGHGELTMEPQKRLTRILKESMKSVNIDSYAVSEKTYVDKNAIVVSGADYSAFSSEELEKNITEYKNAHKDEIVGDELYCSLGTPRLMDKNKLIAMTNETRENLLVVANPSEHLQTMSVLVSLMKCASMQQRNIAVWAYGRNKLYQNNKELFGREEYCVSEDVSAICKSISELKASIQKKELQNRVIILLGMDRICEEIELDAAYKSVCTDISDDNGNKSDDSVSEDNAVLREDVAAVWIPRRLELLEQLRKSDKTEEEIAEIIKAEFEICRKEFISEDNSDSDVYDARGDFDYILRYGSRLGNHFVFVANSLSEIENCGLSTEYFRYKAAFGLSENDSEMLFGYKSAGNLLEHVGQFDDNYEKYSFRPYIHAGLGWDGWNIDENGNLINPNK